MEKRVINEVAEVRAEGDKTYIEGYGILFNNESRDLGGFNEVINPDALKEANMSDVIGRAEHDNAYVLGRTTSGTMELSMDDKGIYYRIEAPNTTAGRDIVEYIKRGDMIGSSFAFSGVSDKWTEDDAGKVTRTITDIAKIHDIGPVFSPAYSDTTTALRSLEIFKKEIKENEVIGLRMADKVKLKLHRAFL